MLRLAFDFIITWRETRTRPNAYSINREGVLEMCISCCARCVSHAARDVHLIHAYAASCKEDEAEFTPSAMLP